MLGANIHGCLCCWKCDVRLTYGEGGGVFCCRPRHHHSTTIIAAPKESAITSATHDVLSGTKDWWISSLMPYTVAKRIIPRAVFVLAWSEMGWKAKRQVAASMPYSSICQALSKLRNSGRVSWSPDCDETKKIAAIIPSAGRNRTGLMTAWCFIRQRPIIYWGRRGFVREVRWRNGSAVF